MNAMKLAMIAILIACTTVCLSSTGSFKKTPKKVINTTLVKALGCPGLVAAMHAQLNPGFLNNYQLVYTVDVTYENILYRITGTAAQWNAFFTPKWKLKSEIRGTINHQ